MMKPRFSYVAIFLIALLASCGRGGPTPVLPTPTGTTPPTATLNAPAIKKTEAPDAQNAAREYLDSWKGENYPAMYAMLTQVSRDALAEKEFTDKYTKVAAEAALDRGIDYQVLSSLTNPQSAQVSYRVTLHSVLVGDIERDTVMNLSLEAGQWKVQWDDALILPELKGGNILKMEYKVPSRANIYDRNGHALVAQTEAVAIKLDAGAVDEDQQKSLLSVISEMTKGRIRPENLGAEIDKWRPYGYGIPVADIAADQFAPYESQLAAYSGVIFQPFQTRYYYDEVAPHVVGFMSAIQPNEVEHYQRLGYGWSERVGRAGLELWGEQYLAGKRGGTLYVVDPSGAIVTILAESETQPSQAIYTTLDRDLQLGAQQALNGYNGAIVVLERDSGRVLAMASSPGFNPNMFEPSNVNSNDLIKAAINDANQPFWNRAAQGLYPLGSVFKLITMAAALQSKVYNSESTYECGYQFDELAGITLNDWTWEHFQKDGKTQPSGHLTLPEGLMRSCNPFFWHIGLDLYRQGLTTAISDMAKGFGLDSPTGIELEEKAGQIPVPGSEVDATNNAIGQGATQVTPLQVADFVAAIGNGGILYRPSVIEKIVPPDGEPTYVFTPTIRGTLPISPTNLTIIQKAMVSVIKEPGGTAHFVFPNFEIPIAGKTGTAQDPPRDPHAWFVVYTFANRKDKPDIAVAVVVENAGEGSEIAAPIAKGILQLYYYGSRGSFPWESVPGVWKTATPEVTPTSEEPTETPEP